MPWELGRMARAGARYGRPSIYEVLGSIPITAKRKKRKIKGLWENQGEGIVENLRAGCSNLGGGAPTGLLALQMTGATLCNPKEIATSAPELPTSPSNYPGGEGPTVSGKG